MAKLFKKTMKEHYHFIGIGGIGMGGLASLLFDQGHMVTGCDSAENAMVKSLKEKGIRIFIGHDSDHIEKADHVIYSSAIPSHCMELVDAKIKGKAVYRRADLLANLMKDSVGITVAGAHGKTTTSSMISHLLYHTGHKPTSAVGGIINGLNTNAFLGEGEIFVAEVDESDGSFLNFFPKYSVITNIDYEHADYYRDWDQLLRAFTRFVEQTKDDGLVVMYGGDENLMKIAKESKKNIKTYGEDEGNDFRIKNYKLNGFISSFECFYREKNLGEFKLSVPGEHNCLNALATIAIAKELGIDLEKIRQGLAKYKGVKRRFELKGHIQEIYVIDDYAHHPTEISMTLKTAKMVLSSLKGEDSVFSNGRLIGVFQPHRYSRFQSLYEDFITCLKDCDYLIVTDVYSAGEYPREGLSIHKFCEQVQKQCNLPVFYLNKEDITSYLGGQLKRGDICITLGAGDITKTADQIVTELKNRSYKSKDKVREKI